MIRLMVEQNCMAPEKINHDAAGLTHRYSTHEYAWQSLQADTGFDQQGSMPPNDTITIPRQPTIIMYYASLPSLPGPHAPLTLARLATSFPSHPPASAATQEISPYS